jgi:hypothetical protein
MDIEKFILTLPLVLFGLAAATGLISYSYNYTNTLKKLSKLWVLYFFVELAGHVTRYFDIKNHWIYNIWFWILYISLAHLYYQIIPNAFIRNSIRWFYVAFPMLVTAECFFYGIEKLQTIVIVVGGTFVILLSTAYFRQLYLSENSESITVDPWFWFSFGFIIHFGGTIPFLGMLNYLLKVEPEFTRVYYFYFCNSFTSVMNILIITGFLCRSSYHKLR